MSDITPDEALREFAKTLPLRISGNILPFVLAYASGEEFIIGQADRIKRLDDMLSHPDRLSRLGVVLRLRAAFDFVIWRAEATTPEIKARARRMQAKGGEAAKLAEEMMAGEDLWDHHIGAVVHRWQALRTGPLSDQSLLAEENQAL